MMWMAIAAAAMKVVGQITEGNEADKVGTRNADALNRRAGDVERAAGTREGMKRENTRQALASQRASMYANGVSPTTGSALVGAEQQMRDAELDALQIRYEGILEATNLRNQADMARYEGKAKKSQSRFSAATSLMSSMGGYMSQTQAPAPVSTATSTPNPYYKGG